MVVDTEYENNVENWINSRTPDTSELARLLLKAKGVHRNMTEFAKECGTSASTFSRIANCKIKQAIPTELLEAIAEHADPDSGVEKRHLFHANGMITKMFAERKQQWSTEFRQDEEMFSRENEIKNIIISDLVDRGNSIQLLNHVDDDGASRLVRSIGRTGLLLHVEGCEAEYWKFRVMNLQGISYVDASGELRHRPNYKGEATLLLSRLAEVFLEDVWYPEKLHMCKMSFVFRSVEYYEAFNELVKDKKFNNWFSTILVDTEKRHVVEEYVFNRHDGKQVKSPLNYPLLTISDDDDGDGIEGSIFGEDD